MDELRPAKAQEQRALDYEYCVIGAIFIEPTCMQKLAPLVSPSDFSIALCGRVFEWAKDAMDRGKPFDAAIAAEMLEKDIGKDAASEFAKNCMDMTPTVVNAPYYAREIRKQADLRRLREALYELGSEKDDPKDLAATVGDVCRKYLETESAGGLKTLMNVLTTYCQMKTQETESIRIDTGYSHFDAILKGFWGGQLCVIAARPNVGKSAFALEIARRAAKEGNKTLVYSLEMPDVELAERMISYNGPALGDLIDMKTTKENKELWGKIVESCGNLSKLPLYINDNPRMTVAKLRAELHTMQDVKFVVVDYLTLMQSEKRYDKRYQEVGAFTRDLKLLAKEMKIPIVALAQVGRNKDSNAPPGLRDLRESGDIEQDADKIVFIWDTQTGTEECPTLGIRIAKNRRGGKGDVFMRFDGAHMAFYETERPAGLDIHGNRRGGGNGSNPYDE